MTEESETQDRSQEGPQPYPGVIGGEEVTPDKDDALAWIMKGLGRECSAAVRRRAGDEAGPDAGQWFYQLFFSECCLAVRADCLMVYVASVSKLASLPKLSELIGSTRIADPAQLTAQQLRGSLMVDHPTWVRLSAGTAPTPEGAASYCLPGDPDHPLEAAHLEGLSASLEELIDAAGFDPDQVANTRSIAAMPGEVIGQIGAAGEGRDGRDVFGRPLPHKGLQGHPQLGAHVKSDDGRLVAGEYGYVFLHDDKLSILSPIWLEEDNSRAYWFCLDRRARPVTTELIERWLRQLQVVEGVDQAAIDAGIAGVTSGDAEAMYTIARGVPANDGEDATLEVLIERGERYGTLREDGLIDLSRSRFNPEVRAGQEVARLLPATAGSPGRDLMGNVIAARDGRPLQVKAGAGIRVEDGVRNYLHYYAEREGALKAVPGELAVVETMVIDSDVGFDTGNLEYGGEIVVRGGVGQGFTVKASGNVFVFGSVDAGSTIVCGGDVVIGHGIAGRRTRVVARGDVRTGYIHEARVRAGGNIVVGNHVVQAILQADGVVSVEEREGPRGGSISGGEVWGLSGIRLHTAGSMQHNRTSLTAGMDPDGARRLDLLNRKLEESNKLIVRHLSRFNLRKLDVKAIQQRLTASTGPQKKVLARAARQLGELVQAHQAMLQERRQVEEGSSGGHATAFVEASKAVFPGVIVRIGDSKREVKSPMRKSLFRLRGEVMDIS